jgi:hypothetical protein
MPFEANFQKMCVEFLCKFFKIISIVTQKSIIINIKQVFNFKDGALCMSTFIFESVILFNIMFLIRKYWKVGLSSSWKDTVKESVAAIIAKRKIVLCLVCIGVIHQYISF